MESKRCSKCGQVKPVTEFHKDKTNATGFKCRCKVCTAEVSRLYHAQNQEKEREKCRAYYHSRKANPVLHAADLARKRDACRQWREKNRQRVRQTIFCWQKVNRDRLTAIRMRRKAHKVGNGGGFTAQEWQCLCDRYGNRCLACGRRRKLTADHVVALSKGGTSFIENIQPLCGPCNSSKGNKTIDYRR